MIEVWRQRMISPRLLTTILTDLSSLFKPKKRSFNSELTTGLKAETYSEDVQQLLKTTITSCLKGQQEGTNSIVMQTSKISKSALNISNSMLNKREKNVLQRLLKTSVSTISRRNKCNWTSWRPWTACWIQSPRKCRRTSSTQTAPRKWSRVGQAAQGSELEVQLVKERPCPKCSQLGKSSSQAWPGSWTQRISKPKGDRLLLSWSRTFKRIHVPL